MKICFTATFNLIYISSSKCRCHMRERGSIRETPGAQSRMDTKSFSALTLLFSFIFFLGQSKISSGLPEIGVTKADVVYQGLLVFELLQLWWDIQWIRSSWEIWFLILSSSPSMVDNNYVNNDNRDQNPYEELWSWLSWKVGWLCKDLNSNSQWLYKKIQTWIDRCQ